MIGLDTNVLVRYIAQDDSSQSPRATKFIERQCSPDNPGFISLITLAEVVWVSESCYGATRDMVAKLVRQLLGTKQLVVQSAEVAWKALRLFEAGSADFADRLVNQVSKDAGCDMTMTFDKSAAKSGMSLLK